MKEIFIKDKSELYKKMWLYKTILYKKVIIKSDIDDEESKKIIQALNIKNRKERIKFIYDYCCNYIDDFGKGKNICGFSDCKCILQQTPECKNKNGCCKSCPHQSEKRMQNV